MSQDWKFPPIEDAASLQSQILCLRNLSHTHLSSKGWASTVPGIWETLPVTPASSECCHPPKGSTSHPPSPARFPIPGCNTNLRVTSAGPSLPSDPTNHYNFLLCWHPELTPCFPSSPLIDINTLFSVLLFLGLGYYSYFLTGSSAFRVSPL